MPRGAPRGFRGDSDGKESACATGDLGSIPGLGRSSGGGHGNPLQYSCLENPHGQRSLAGCSPWGREELDTTERPPWAFINIWASKTWPKQAAFIPFGQRNTTFVKNWQAEEVWAWGGKFLRQWWGLLMQLSCLWILSLVTKMLSILLVQGGCLSHGRLISCFQGTKEDCWLLLKEL